MKVKLSVLIYSKGNWASCRVRLGRLARSSLQWYYTRDVILHVGCRIAVISVETNMCYILVQVGALETHLKLSLCFKREILIYFKLSKLI